MNKAAWDRGAWEASPAPPAAPSMSLIYYVALAVHMAVYTDASAQMCVCVSVCVQLRVKRNEKKMATPRCKETRCDKKHDDVHRAFSWHRWLYVQVTMCRRAKLLPHVSGVRPYPKGRGPGLHRFVAKFHRHSCCDSEDLCQPLKLPMTKK